MEDYTNAISLILIITAMSVCFTPILTWVISDPLPQEKQTWTYYSITKWTKNLECGVTNRQ